MITSGGKRNPAKPGLGAGTRAGRRHTYSACPNLPSANATVPLGTTPNPDRRWTTQQIREPGDRSRRSPHPVAGPRLRPGRSVRRAVRRCPGRCGHPRGQDSSALPAGELFRRTVRPHYQSRTHRPHADLQSAALACGAHELRSALQRSTTPPRPRTSPTTAEPPRGGPQPGTDQTSPVYGRPDQRVRTSGIKPLLSIGSRLLEPRRFRCRFPI
jgi:hypothetical protein